MNKIDFLSLTHFKLLSQTEGKSRNNYVSRQRFVISASKIIGRGRHKRNSYATVYNNIALSVSARIFLVRYAHFHLTLYSTEMLLNYLVP